LDKKKEKLERYFIELATMLYSECYYCIVTAQWQYEGVEGLKAMVIG